MVIIAAVWSTTFLFIFDFFTPIGRGEGDRPMVPSSSSKLGENEEKPGDACVGESRVGFSDSKKVCSTPHGIDKRLGGTTPS